MSAFRFEWDDRKAAANVSKHGVTFDEARSMFFDERSRLIDDPDHSTDEERFILLGLSSTLRLLLVVHCYRRASDVVRIISARKATTFESKFYPWQVPYAQRVRFFQIQEEPLRRSIEEANYHSP